MSHGRQNWRFLVASGESIGIWGIIQEVLAFYGLGIVLSIAVMEK